MTRVEYVDDHEVYSLDDCDIDEEMQAHVHFLGVTCSDYTLCGLAEGDQPTRKTTKKVTCPYCIDIVEECKKISVKEYER